MRPTPAPYPTRTTGQCLLSGLMALLLASLTASHLSLAQAAPAQKPLLKSPGGSVAPNIFYTMDDSGSMAWMYAPSTTDVWGGEKNGIAPLAHPLDSLDESGNTCLVRTPDATVATYDAASRAAMRLRSSAVNKIYYNPTIRYLPWAKYSEADGSFPNSSFTAATMDPSGVKTGTINLSTTLSNRQTTWCTSNGTQNATYTLYPASYYNIVGTYDATKTTDRYVQVRLDDAGSPPADFPKAEDRTDCVAIAGRCSLAEERVNFANWFTYYRTRSLMARGSSSLAFSSITQKVRMGYGQLNNGEYVALTNKSATEAGQTLPNITRGVRDFDVGSATRQQFFEWLYKIKFQSGTPLRQAMDNVGKYFQITNSTGPWGTTPGTGTGTNNDAAWKVQASCRRSYHILMTDGYWNGSAASVTGNYDGTSSSTTIANNEDGRTYTYNATYTNGINTTKSPYADNASGTLADVAQYYWMNDLHPNLNNNIRTSFTAEEKTISSKPYYNAAEKIDRLDHAFWQHLTTYTVGLGLTGTIKDITTVPPATAWPTPTSNAQTTVDDLFHAAVNGRGKYVQASDPKDYQEKMQDTLNEIFAAQEAVSGLSLSSFQVSSTSLVYVPSFSNPQWTGDVLARPANDANKVTWVASKMLPEAVDRKIFVSNGNGLEPFNTTLSTGMRTLLGDPGNDLIKFLRGDRSLEGNGYRCRGDQPGTTKCKQTKDKDTGLYTKKGLFGDVVNSNPVLLAANVDLNYQLLNSTEASTYREFVAKKAKRLTNENENAALVVGANDGMLHVLNAKTGAEVFAYMPQAVVGNLKRLSNRFYGNTTDDTQGTAHRYFVDGKLNETDVVINGKWANVVVGSTGAGAKAVFALKFDAEKPKDFSLVTPTAMKDDQNPFLWEINDTPSSGLTDKAKLGYITGNISTGRMKNGRWVAIFGNGADSTNGGAHLWIVDIGTGVPIKVIQAGTDTAGNGLGPVSPIRDGNRNIVGAYAGDLKGRLWRFDLESTSSADWKVGLAGQPLLSISPSRPITSAPLFTIHPKGGLMVMFGTGQLYATGDETNTDTQSLYGVWDLTTPGATSAASLPATMGQIVTQTISPTPVVTAAKLTGYKTSSTSTTISYDPGGRGKRGWKVDQALQAGERNIFNPFLLANIAFFNTVGPSIEQAGDPCMGVKISSYVYGLNPFSGQMPTFALFDTSGNGVIGGEDAILAAIENDGEDGSVTATKEDPKLCPDGSTTCTPCEPGTKDCKDGSSGVCPKGSQEFQFRSSASTKKFCAAVGFSVRSWQQLNNFPKNPNLGKK